MPKIARIHGREVLDSRGQPTVQVEVFNSDGSHGSAIVPAGASTGKAEAQELRDGDPARYDGRGVMKAVAHVNEILGPAVIGRDPADQAAIDRLLCELDGTPQKSRLGANAILGVSLAVAHAAAAAARVPLYLHFNRLWQARLRESNLHIATDCRLPLPMTNMISGGLHAGGNLDFQDFLIMPVGATSYRVGLEWIVRVYRRLGELLAASGYEGRLVGDEGGFGPRLPSNRSAAEFVVRAIEAARLRPGADVTIAVDVASSHFFDGQRYRLKATGEEQLTSDQMIDQLSELVEALPITSIEDGLAEDDWEGWPKLTRRLGSRVQLVGDDLFATHPERIRRGIELGAANAVLIKVNQIGTLSETLQAMAVARSGGLRCVVSARSGETEDATIADLAVATAADQIKIGSIQRSERLAKYNRLLAIEEDLSALSTLRFWVGHVYGGHCPPLDSWWAMPTLRPPSIPARRADKALVLQPQVGSALLAPDRRNMVLVFEAALLAGEHQAPVHLAGVAEIGAAMRANVVHRPHLAAALGANLHAAIQRRQTAQAGARRRAGVGLAIAAMAGILMDGQAVVVGRRRRAEETDDGVVCQFAGRHRNQHADLTFRTKSGQTRILVLDVQLMPVGAIKTYRHEALPLAAR